MAIPPALADDDQTRIMCTLRELYGPGVEKVSHPARAQADSPSFASTNEYS